MSGIKRGTLNVAQGRVFPATVIDVVKSRCSIRLANNGQILRNLPYSGGPLTSGDDCLVSYESGSPVVMAIGRTGATSVTRNPMRARTVAPERIPTGGGSITVEEEDGAPSVSGVRTIRFANGSVTDEGSGIVSVEVEGGGALDDLTDVDAPAPADGQVLTWDDAAEEWVAADPSGGGVEIGAGVYNLWDPFAPPISPNALDDEFDDGTLSGWAESDPNSRLTASEVNGYMELTSTSGSLSIAGLYKTIPAGDFTLTAHVSISGAKANWLNCGIALWEDAANPTTKGIYTVGVNMPNGTVGATRWNHANSWNSNLGSAIDASYYSSAWLRITRSGSTYTFLASDNGLSWIVIWSGSLAFTPLHFGVHSENENSGATSKGRFHCFRYAPTAASITDPTYGRLITMGSRPDILKDTKTAIEAMEPIEGTLAYATDTDELGYADGIAWIWLGSGNGVSDHGALTGLADDDHPHYHNDARGDERYSPLTHSHDPEWADIVNEPKTYQRYYLFPRLLHRQPITKIGGSPSVNPIVSNTEYLISEHASAPSAGLGTTMIPAGDWNFRIIYSSESSDPGVLRLITKVYKRSAAGAETLLFTTTSVIPGTLQTNSVLTYSTTQPEITVNPTDRLVVKFYGLSTNTYGFDYLNLNWADITAGYSYFDTPEMTIAASGVNRLLDLADVFQELSSEDLDGMALIYNHASGGFIFVDPMQGGSQETVTSLWSFDRIGAVPPFAVGITNTVRVANLNADMVDGKHASELGGSITVEELDGAPSIAATEIRVARGALANPSAGVAQVRGLYVPVSGAAITDSAGNDWTSGAKALGTYTFRPADNGNLWPATARALHIFMFSVWAAAANTSILNARRSSGGNNEGQVRALVAGVGYSINLNIALDANGYFYANVAGAATQSSTIRVLGYYE